ncbi:ABC transporter ATP-binding protein [Erysipelothrix anatis]|uniref:ABC transporter ATP-binding protein n=1 Tax=Erysipelothrix anatis TaxID=2683713 RepID=UPI00135902AE|nr:ABC transporter ATP-binding protein [Erysipelothrix anatis]
MNVLTIKELVKSYGDFTAVDHFDLEINEGDILGLLGPNGSGKSTTINCILSLLNYEYGEIQIFGKKMSPTAYDIKRHIGIVPQDVAVFDELSVYENIDYFCSLYIKDKKERKICVDEAIEFVGLEEFRKSLPQSLSGGLLRRLNIACGVAHKPKLIILDEPTVAVDPQSRNKILEGIMELNRKGSTILYTSHYMEEIEQICNRIVIMDHGKEIAQGTKESLKALSQYGETITFESFELTEAFVELIREHKNVVDVVFATNEVNIRCKGVNENLFELITFFNTHEIEYTSVRHELPTLNDVFLEITGKELRD